MDKKKDTFEQFVRDNRNHFDINDPRAELWYQIDQAIPNKRKAKVIRFSVISIAASVILLLGLGVGIGYYSNGGFGGDEFYTASAKYDDFPEVEKYFLTQINHKTDELKEMGLGESVEENLTQLDEIYEELKVEFLNAEGKNKEVIVQAMIRNYQTKIEILELILGRSKPASEQNKSMDHETINI